MPNGGVRVIDDIMLSRYACYLIVMNSDSRKDVISMVNDENATVKRFKRENDMVILTPQSTNPENQAQIYNLKDTNIRIIGKVVRVEYSLK